MFHFLGDGQGLVDEPVGQFLHLPFLYRKDEVVLVVMSQRERAVVLTEEGLVADALGLLRDVDIAVAHRLHKAPLRKPQAFAPPIFFCSFSSD